MKKGICLILLAGLTGCFYSQALGQENKIKILKLFSYNIQVLPDGKLQQGTFREGMYYEYNAAGKIVSESVFLSPERKRPGTIYVYDEENRLLKTFKDGVYEDDLCKYYANGNLQEKITYANPDGKQDKRRYQYLYNQYNQVVEEEVFFTDYWGREYLDYVIKYSYNSDRKLIGEIKYNFQGEMVSTRLYTYDDQEQLAGKSESSRFFSSQRKYFRNDKGQVIKEISIGHIPVYEYITTYEYDTASGNVTKMEKTDKGEVYELEEQQYDAKGEVVKYFNMKRDLATQVVKSRSRRFEYVYNKEGDWIKKTVWYGSSRDVTKPALIVVREIEYW